MDWIGWGTFAAAIVAALASVWAALVSHRQLRLASRQADAPEPTVEASLVAIEGRTDWCELRLIVRNNAPIAMDLLSAAVTRPRGARSIYRDPSGGPPLRGSLLVPEIARAEIAIDQRIEKSGHPGHRDVLRVEILVHSPLHRFQKESRPSMRLTLRWRDQAAKQFAIAAKLINPRTMKSEA